MAGAEWGRLNVPTGKGRALKAFPIRNPGGTSDPSYKYFSGGERIFGSIELLAEAVFREEQEKD